MFFIGIFLILLTVFFGPLNPLLLLAAVILPLVLCIVYQFQRNRWQLFTIGEIIIATDSKTDILAQTKKFQISRVPIFVLLTLILIINGNLLDGLGEGQEYHFSSVVLFSIFFVPMYYGSKNFFINPEIPPIALQSAGLLFIGFAFRKGTYLTVSTFTLYWCLAVIWLIIGLIYKWKAVKPTETDSHEKSII